MTVALWMFRGLMPRLNSKVSTTPRYFTRQLNERFWVCEVGTRTRTNDLNILYVCHIPPRKGCLRDRRRPAQILTALPI